jgi:hypothetical protein
MDRSYVKQPRELEEQQKLESEKWQEHVLENPRFHLTIFVVVLYMMLFEIQVRLNQNL